MKKEFIEKIEVVGDIFLCFSILSILLLLVSSVATKILIHDEYLMAACSLFCCLLCFFPVISGLIYFAISFVVDREKKEFKITEETAKE